MKHWLFILILSTVLSGKPTPVSQGQATHDSTQKIPFSGAIASKEEEKEELFDSLKISHVKITEQITRIKKKPVQKVIIKHEIKYIYIHDTVYVMQIPILSNEGLRIYQDNGTPKFIDLSTSKPTEIAAIKKPTFFKRLFHRKKKK